MKSLKSFPRILLYQGQLDFRKRRKSTAAFVQGQLALDPFSATAFVFMNRRKDVVRILYWDGNGFALWEKELEEEKFPWLFRRDGGTIDITAEQGEWLLRGINIFHIHEHKSLQYSLVT